MLQGSSTELSTIYTVLKQVQKMCEVIDQKDAVITFDQAIYSKARQIQWFSPDEFKNTVIRLGGFHIALNFLALLGKKYRNEDLLIESGVYAGGHNDGCDERKVVQSRRSGSQARNGGPLSYNVASVPGLVEKIEKRDRKG